jgi:hypothetical protein
MRRPLRDRDLSGDDVRKQRHGQDAQFHVPFSFGCAQREAGEAAIALFGAPHDTGWRQNVFVGSQPNSGRIAGVATGPSGTPTLSTQTSP